jgi:hypothetical protein
MLEVIARAVGLLAGYGAVQLLLRVIDRVEWPELNEAAA